MKTRVINTKFWSDNYIDTLDPIEKLLFLYLLTNERTNIAGVYELPLKFMAVETGIEKSMVEKILERFEKDEKIIFFDGWVIIKNQLKHQNINNSKIKAGIKRIFDEIPAEIREKWEQLVKNNMTHIYHMYESSHSNSNSNSNPNSNSEKKESEKKNKEKIDFNVFWDFYKKKVGEKEKIKKKWDKLSLADQEAVLDYLPKYIAAQPEKRYRKNPETFLNNKSWNDEIIDHRSKQPEYLTSPKIINV